MDTDRFILERCEPDCVGVTATVVPHDGAWVLKPSSPLVPGAYRASVLAGYEDTQGNAGTAFTWTFAVVEGFGTPSSDPAAQYGVTGVKALVSSGGARHSVYVESIADNESHLMMSTHDGTTFGTPRRLHLAIGVNPSVLDVAEGLDEEVYVFWTAGDRYYLTHVDGQDVETEAVALDDDGSAAYGAGRVVVKSDGTVVFVWLDDGYGPFAIRSRTLVNGVYSPVVTLAGGQVDWFNSHERGLALEVTGDTIHVAWAHNDGVGHTLKTVRHGASGWSPVETVATSIGWTWKHAFSAASATVAAFAWVEFDGSGYGYRVWSAIRRDGVWHKTSRSTCNCYSYDIWNRPEPLGVAIVVAEDASAVLAWNYVGSYDPNYFQYGGYNYDQRVWFASQAIDGAANMVTGWTAPTIQEAWSFNGSNYAYQSSGDHVLLGRRAGDTAVFVGNYWYDYNNDAIDNGEPQLAIGTAYLTTEGVSTVSWYTNLLSYSVNGSNSSSISLGQVAFATAPSQMLFASDLGVIATAPAGGGPGAWQWLSPTDLQFGYDLSDSDESFASVYGQYAVAVDAESGLVASATTLGYNRVAALTVSGGSADVYSQRILARAAPRDSGFATVKGQKFLSGPDGSLAVVRAGNYQVSWSSNCSGSLEEPMATVTRRDPVSGLWSPNAVVTIDYQQVGFNIGDWFNNCWQWGGGSAPNDIVSWDAELMGDRVALAWYTSSHNANWWSGSDMTVFFAVDPASRASRFAYHADWDNSWMTSPTLDLAVDGNRLAAALQSNDSSQYSRSYVLDDITAVAAYPTRDDASTVFSHPTAAYGYHYTSNRSGFGAGHGELVWGALIQNSSHPYDQRLRIALRDSAGSWVAEDWSGSDTTQPGYDTVSSVLGQGRMLEPGWGRIAAMISDNREGTVAIAACDHIRELGVECTPAITLPAGVSPTDENVVVLPSGQIAALWYESARKVIRLQVGDDFAEVNNPDPTETIQPRLSVDEHGGVVVAWQVRNADLKYRVKSVFGSVVGPTLGTPVALPIPEGLGPTMHYYLQDRPGGGGTDGAMLAQWPHQYWYTHGYPSYVPRCTFGCGSRCGDGVCGGAEDELNCPADCAYSPPRFGFVMDGADGAELAVSSCSVEGTSVVELGAGAAAPEQLSSWRGSLFFTATTATEGRELWRLDRFGEARRLTDLAVGGGDGLPGFAPRWAGDRWIQGFKNDLYFRGADDGLHRVRAGIADGAPALVADLAGTGVGGPMGLTVAGPRLYFIATQTSGGGEGLAYVDASTGSVTVMLDETSNPFGAAHIASIHALGDTLVGFERVDDGAGGYRHELFRVDPTSSTVTRVLSLTPGPLESGPLACMAPLNGMVVFEGPFGGSRHWFAADGYDLYMLGAETLSCTEGGLLTSDGQLLTRAVDPTTGLNAFSVRGYTQGITNLGFDALAWAELDGSLFYLAADGLGLYDYAPNETPEVVYASAELKGSPLGITGSPWLAMAAEGTSDQLLCIDPTTPVVRAITVRSGAEANVRSLTVIR
jgi:ELWxxDGT repeat protein